MIKEELSKLNENVEEQNDIQKIEKLMTDIWLKDKSDSFRVKQVIRPVTEEDVKKLYNELSDVTKPFLITNLEMYAERYGAERPEYALYLSAINSDDGEYDMLPRPTEDPMGREDRGGRTSQLRKKYMHKKPEWHR